MPIFVVHHHWATREHYDLRIQYKGVLKSWAVPKQPPLKPGIKRLAVHVPDHKLSYAKFQGKIQKGQYGAGTVKIWDKGTINIKLWTDKKIEVIFKGKKLKGPYALVPFKSAGEKNWLLFKERIKK